METNYIYNVKTPIDSDKGVNKSYADTELSLSCDLMIGNLDINKHNIMPSDHTDRFAYLMDPKNGLLQWTDLLTNSITLNSIGYLETTSGNYHTYNKKVINASIRKNSEGRYEI